MANTSVSFDWNKLSELSTSLKTDLTNFETAIDDLFKKIGDMGSAWKGPSYDAFVAYCQQYRTTKIQSIQTDIQTWVDNLNTLASKAQSTSDTNKGLFTV